MVFEETVELTAKRVQWAVLAVLSAASSARGDAGLGEVERQLWEESARLERLRDEIDGYAP